MTSIPDEMMFNNSIIISIFRSKPIFKISFIRTAAKELLNEIKQKEITGLNQSFLNYERDTLHFFHIISLVLKIVPSITNI
jgi:hypothetical protein